MYVSSVNLLWIHYAKFSMVGGYKDIKNHKLSKLGGVCWCENGWLIRTIWYLCTLTILLCITLLFNSHNFHIDIDTLQIVIKVPHQWRCPKIMKMPDLKSRTTQIRLEATSQRKVDFCLNESQFNFCSHLWWSRWFDGLEVQLLYESHRFLTRAEYSVMCMCHQMYWGNNVSFPVPIFMTNALYRLYIVKCTCGLVVITRPVFPWLHNSTF